MSIRQYKGTFKKASAVFFLMLMTCLCLLSVQATANTPSYKLEEIAQLTHSNLKDSNWKQVVVNPNNKQQYFIINELGQLYLLDEEVSTPALLDLNISKQNKESFTFTAIALHPNFSFRDQSGFAVFYTAHLEPIDKNSTTKRIEERSTQIKLSHDAVITEWKFNTATYKQVDESTKREVLRIGVPSNDISIMQMSFNPSIKSWNDNFGLLHIALSGDKAWQKPLYSGVILRINPEKFGLRSFTVPTSNPFLKEVKIKDAIYVLGAQHIKQFIWPDKNTERLLLLHRYANNHLLSMASGGNDFREPSAIKKILHQTAKPINAIALYKGRQLPVLRNKLLFLQHASSHWQMHSLPLSAISTLNKTQNLPVLEWQLPVQQFSATSQLNLVTGFLSELLLLDNSNKLFYRLNQESSTPLVVDNAPPSTESESNHYDLIVFAILIAMGAGFYLFKFNKVSAKKLVREQYASLELRESNQQVALYHRHQKNADIIIDLVDIVSSEILLNEQSISLINGDEGYGFSNEKEQDLRGILTKEHVEKMIDGKLRQITLQLVDKQKHNHSICLYMRKGSDRITKKCYLTVIEELTDWCWLFAQQVNPDNTGQRKIIAIPNVTEHTSKQDEKEVLLHHQTAVVRPALYKPKSESEESISKGNSMKKDSTTDAEVVKQDHNEVHKEASVVDTELVNALEKLVDLKQQGYLTLEEFSQAKAKLFESLIDKK